VLEYIKYVEDINGDVQTIREWTPETITTWTLDLERREIEPEFTEVNGLGYVPAVCVYANRSQTRGVGISDIADIADAQKFIYNATSEVEQSIRLDSHPSLVKTPETEAGSGAGSMIHMPDNLDPGLKPYLLEYSGAEISSIYTSISNTIDSIDKMANTGAVRAIESRPMSGVAMETEFQLLNARLSDKADLLELAEESMWRIWADYQGLTYDIHTHYPDSFNIRDDRDYLAQLHTVRELVTGTDREPVVIAEIWRLLALPEPEVTATRQYENGEPIDPRLPEAYRNATGEPSQCENCAAYDADTFQCQTFGGAPVRPMWVCARWQPVSDSV
jgi:hypothetical protein